MTVRGRQTRVFFVAVGDPEYPRTRMTIDGLSLNGLCVQSYSFRRPGAGGWLRRIAQFLRQHRHVEYDLMWVGPSGHFLLPLLRCIAKAPIVFDAYFSVYQTVVEEKRRCPARGIRASLWKALDVLVCRLSHRVVLDTRAQIDYFLREYSLWPGKFASIPVGADDRVFHPLDRPAGGNAFHVVFWGSFIRLQGVPVIIEAASHLRDCDIEFTLLGDGPEREQAEQQVQQLGLQNVHFRPRTGQVELNGLQSEADICLGIFGDTAKALQVIPNKAYAALASKRLLVTGDSPAIREAFKHQEHLWLVPMGDSQSLAQALLHLRDHPSERQRIASCGHDMYRSRFTVEKIGHLARSVVEETLNERNPLPNDVGSIQMDDGSAHDIDPAMMCDHRPDLVAAVPDDAVRVLDVGCGLGYLGRVLKARAGVEVVGVEICEPAARTAQQWLDAVHTELETLAQTYDPGYFDCIIFGDVLEHMVSPWLELRRCLDHLRAGGTVIASLPNAAHWTNIWELMMNRFDYEPRGIRCDSHLRFFTSASGRRMLESAGLNVSKISANYRLFDRSFAGFPLRLPTLCKLLSARVFRHFFAFQYLYVGVKVPDQEDMASLSAGKQRRHTVAARDFEPLSRT